MKLPDVFVFLALLAGSGANEQVDFKDSVYDIWEGCEEWGLVYRQKQTNVFFR